MNVDKKRQALENEIAAERVSGGDKGAEQKDKKGDRATRGRAAENGAKGSALRLKFLVLALIVVALIAFGLLAGPRIGDWLSATWDSVVNGEPAAPAPMPAAREPEPAAVPELAEPKAPTTESLAAEVEALTARLEGLSRLQEAGLSRLASQMRELEDRLGGIAARESPDGAVSAAEIEEIRTQLKNLAARLAALEARGGSPGGPDMRLTSALLAQRADAGRPYRVELLQLEALQPALGIVEGQEARTLIEKLRPAARTGVATFDELRRAFEPLIVKTLTSSQGAAAAGPLDKIWTGIKNLVVVRRTGDAEGETLDARLARAERRLASNDLAGAVAEVEAIEGETMTPLVEWLADARARLEVTAAAERLERLIDDALRSGG